MNIGGYSFSDSKPIAWTEEIERAVVYVVMTHDGQYWYYLYVGQTGDLSVRFGSHEKWPCWWSHQKSGGLLVSYLLVNNQDQRLDIETQLRNSLYGLPCNKQ